MERKSIKKKKKSTANLNFEKDYQEIKEKEKEGEKGKVVPLPEEKTALFSSESGRDHSYSRGLHFQWHEKVDGGSQGKEERGFRRATVLFNRHQNHHAW